MMETIAMAFNLTKRNEWLASATGPAWFVLQHQQRVEYTLGICCMVQYFDRRLVSQPTRTCSP